MNNRRRGAAGERETKRSYAPEYHKKWRDANREYVRAKGREWRLKNIEKARKFGREWAVANRHRPDIVAKRKEYERKNKWRLAAASRERQAMRRRATMKWSNREAIQTIYMFADFIRRHIGVDCHVDHIVPLVAKDVDTKERTASGLHTEYNLQVLRRRENESRGPWFKPGYVSTSGTALWWTEGGLVFVHGEMFEKFAAQRAWKYTIINEPDRTHA